jgi:4-hydroxy-tetrahydrodipicolinate synthase
MKWQGVIPAITTPFRPDLSVDADLLLKQVEALVRAGCSGIVALGSLGEGGSLGFDEKKAVLRLCREALGGRASLVAGIAALTTAEALRLAELAREQEADGLMVLPPYVYRGDCPACSTTTRSPTARTSCPSSCCSSRKRCPTCWRSRSRARTCGG